MRRLRFIRAEGLLVMLWDGAPYFAWTADAGAGWRRVTSASAGFAFGGTADAGRPAYGLALPGWPPNQLPPPFVDGLTAGTPADRLAP